MQIARAAGEPFTDVTTVMSAPLPRRGDRVGRYVVVDRLGEGGMGVVFSAWDPLLDRAVALKLLRERADAEATARLLREAQALARVSHPNVIAVYDLGVLPEGAFVAMELVEGQTLDAWLRKSPRPVQLVVRAFAAAGRGLHAAHRAGVVHRDFKPDNVILGKDGRVRVLDFGLARSGRDAEPAAQRPDAPVRLDTPITQAGRIMGTPAYMAPEQYEGRRADQFAFCVALWEALTGARPFAGSTRWLLYRAMVERRLQRPAEPGALGAVLDVLARGLSPKPDDRFASVEALVQALVQAAR